MQSARVLAFSFLENHPDEAAAILELRPSEEVSGLLEQVSAQIAAALLQKMLPSAAAAAAAQMSIEQVRAVAGVLPVGSIAALIRQLDPTSRDSLLRAMPRHTAAPLQRILSYPEGTAGALMDARMVAFPQDITVENARTRLRRAPDRSAYYLYVVDRDQHLVGVLTVSELFLANRGDLLAAVMRSPVERLPARADQRSILDHPAWRVYHALPVVDEGGCFLGVIQHKTLRALKRDTSPETSRAAAMETAMRLGELLWIALANLLTGFAGPNVSRGLVNDRVRRD